VAQILSKACQHSRRLCAVSELQSERDLALSEEASRLQSLVNWLAGNGVQGIGGDDANVAIYQEASGMRGVVCLKVMILLLWVILHAE
jgi:hypothetical protein